MVHWRGRRVHVRGSSELQGQLRGPPPHGASAPLLIAPAFMPHGHCWHRADHLGCTTSIQAHTSHIHVIILVYSKGVWFTNKYQPEKESNRLTPRNCSTSDLCTLHSGVRVIYRSRYKIGEESNCKRKRCQNRNNEKFKTNIRIIVPKKRKARRT